MSRIMLLLAIAGLAGCGLGESAWAIAWQPYYIYSPVSAHAFFLALGFVAGMTWAASQALLWRRGFGFDSLDGLRAGAFSSLLLSVGFLWPLFIRFKLPAPHDLPLRNLQIVFVAQVLTTLSVGLLLLILALSRSRELAQKSPAWTAIRLGALAFCVYMATGFWTASWNNTGDAPHYLMMADSLAYDHDVELSNNYKQGDQREFYKGVLEPQGVGRIDGRQISNHLPGLPLLLAPAYFFGGWVGARMLLALMAAVGSALFYLLSLRSGFRPRLALFGWALLAFSAAWWSHSQIAMVEMPGGLCFLVLLCVWKGILPRAMAPLGITLMALMSLRYVPAACAFAALDFWMLRKKGIARSLGAPFFLALAVAAIMVYNKVNLGDARPLEVVDESRGWGVFIRPSLVPHYFSGLMIDQEYGWLPYSPVFALSFFGVWSLWRRDRGLAAQSVLPALAYIGPIAAFPWWWSAMAPNRYLVCLTPFFALWALEAWRAWGNRAA
ncbi:MAG: hypothetical protein V4498_06450, partial [candidate division FCPU426 bacterium]